MSGFSAAVKLGDLDDFLSPANDCIVPLTSSKAAIIKPVAVEAASPVVAGITLSDCLACSGCVTSAETVLLQSQSVDELLSRIAAAPEMKVVISVSSASRRALSTYYQVSEPDLTGWLFKQLAPLLGPSLSAVLDMSLAEAVVLSESMKELETKKHPILTSHCPGWTCYASKILGADVLTLLSRVKSAEQIQGLIIKRVVPKCCKLKPMSGRILHILFAPCFDKKLEIIRPGYHNMVDLALSSTECIDMVQRALKFEAPSPAFPEPIYTLLGLCDVWEPPSLTSSAILSGGYAQVAANRSDLSEWRLSGKSDIFQCGSDFLRSHGFRNIQNVTRRVRSGQLDAFKLIEVMACPGGCPSGGGQPKGQADKPVTSYWEKLQALLSYSSSNKKASRSTIVCDPDAFEPAIVMRRLLTRVCPQDMYTEWNSLALDAETGEKKVLASDLKW